MSKDLEKETNKLKLLLTDESLKAPDKSGITPLMLRAKENSVLNPLSPAKNFEEIVVCNLIKYFGKFDQVNFSELENYVRVSMFSNDKIVQAFKGYVVKQDEVDDKTLIFKACVGRMVQNLEKNAFSLDFISKRFERLEKNDPWLLSELVIRCNWKAGVKQIKENLEKNYDASYLFSLLPIWIRDNDNSKSDISFALSEWFPLLNENDKEMALYYADNHGFNIDKLNEKDTDCNPEAVKEIVEGDSFKEFLKKSPKPNFQSLVLLKR